MTLRDDLEECIRDLASGEYYDKRAYSLIRDHGPALLEAVEMAERGRWMIDRAAWIRHGDSTVMEIRLPSGLNLSSWGLRRDAIDAAREGEKG